MTVARSVSDVLAEHVTFEVECVDRLYLNVYVPKLQRVAGVVGFLRGHRGFPFASGALLDPISKAFVGAIHRFVRDQNVPLIDFVKGQRKDDVAAEQLACFDRPEGVVFVGRAQEKARICRTEKRRNPTTGVAYPWIVPGTAMVNYFYFYGLDDDFGPFFVKFCSYFPYNAKLYVNGHEWAKRQAAKAGIGFTALDNGFAAVNDPDAVQEICDQLGPEHIDALLRKWLAILPHPFTAADRAAGYRYDISVLQAEFSLTQVLDRPVSGRVFFEEVIRDNLDLGRPDQVGLVFDRKRRVTKRTPGGFRTRVITDGVTPSLHVDYKHSKIKQYHKLGRALRTETTVNDTRDFGIGKRLPNLPALRRIGFCANRRLLDVQRLSHDPIDGAAAISAVNDPLLSEGGRRVAGLRILDRRVQALLAVLLIFRLQPNGFTSRDLRAHLAELLGIPAISLTTGRISYDLRRLRLHGLIERVPGSHRYQVTVEGLRIAMFLTRVHDRLLRRGLAELCDDQPPAPSPLRSAAQRYDQAVTTLMTRSGLAA